MLQRLFSRKVGMVKHLYEEVIPTFQHLECCNVRQMLQRLCLNCASARPGRAAEVTVTTFAILRNVVTSPNVATLDVATFGPRRRRYNIRQNVVTGPPSARMLQRLGHLLDVATQ